MTIRIFAIAAMLVLGEAAAAPQIVSADAWREDLRQLDTAIRATHPRPFVHADEIRYRSAVAALERDIERLSDKAITVRMAEIVAAINDGHTRLAIPQKQADIALAIGHSSDPPPSDSALFFSRLPVKFEHFQDGVFVTAAMKQYEEYIGWRLVRLGDVSALDALEAAKRIAFAENDQFARLQAADYLSLPDALEALGVTENAAETALVLSGPARDQEAMLALAPVEVETAEWRNAFAGLDQPLRQQQLDRVFWSGFVAEKNIIYAQINEIADSETMRFAEFAASIVAEAEQRKAKLVIDLRNNFGGSADLNRSLILAIAQSKELNQYGSTFVLIGRRTFSAAQLLCNNLEAYTRVLFVGEPTGARPDHYGDSKKIQLKNSGLTLRVSTLHWSSFFANDRRMSLNPDLLTPWTSAAYFAGEDPAIAAIVHFRFDMTSLLRDAFESNEHYRIGRYLQNARLFPDSADQSVAGLLLDLSKDFERSDRVELAILALRYGAALHPEDASIAAALEELKNNAEKN